MTDHKGPLKTSLLLTLEVPALEVSSSLTFNIKATRSNTILENIEDVVQVLVTEFKSDLQSFDIDGSQKQLDLFRNKALAEVEDWNMKLRSADEWRAKVERASDQMNKMRDQYYREVQLLKQQVHLREKCEKDGTKFVPMNVKTFDPNDYQMEDTKALKLEIAELKKAHLVEFEEQPKKFRERIAALQEQLVTSKMVLIRKEKLMDYYQEKLRNAGLDTEQECEPEPEAQIIVDPLACAQAFKDHVCSKFGSLAAGAENVISELAQVGLSKSLSHGEFRSRRRGRGSSTPRRRKSVAPAKATSTTACWTLRRSTLTRWLRRIGTTWLVWPWTRTPTRKSKQWMPRGTRRQQRRIHLMPKLHWSVQAQGRRAPWRAARAAPARATPTWRSPHPRREARPRTAAAAARRGMEVREASKSVVRARMSGFPRCEGELTGSSRNSLTQIEEANAEKIETHEAEVQCELQPTLGLFRSQFLCHPTAEHETQLQQLMELVDELEERYPQMRQRAKNLVEKAPEPTKAERERDILERIDRIGQTSDPRKTGRKANALQGLDGLANLLNRHGISTANDVEEESGPGGSASGMGITQSMSQSKSGRNPRRTMRGFNKESEKETWSSPKTAHEGKFGTGPLDMVAGPSGRRPSFSGMPSAKPSARGDHPHSSSDSEGDEADHSKQPQSSVSLKGQKAVNARPTTSIDLRLLQEKMRRQNQNQEREAGRMGAVPLNAASVHATGARTEEVLPVVSDVAMTDLAPGWSGLIPSQAFSARNIPIERASVNTEAETRPPASARGTRRGLGRMRSDSMLGSNSEEAVSDRLSDRGRVTFEFQFDVESHRANSSPDDQLLQAQEYMSEDWDSPTRGQSSATLNDFSPAKTGRRPGGGTGTIDTSAIAATGEAGTGSTQLPALKLPIAHAGGGKATLSFSDDAGSSLRFEARSPATGATSTTSRLTGVLDLRKTKSMGAGTTGGAAIKGPGFAADPLTTRSAVGDELKEFARSTGLFREHIDAGLAWNRFAAGKSGEPGSSSPWHCEAFEVRLLRAEALLAWTR